MHIVIFMFTTVLVVVSIAPLFKSDHWLLRVWEFPRVQIIILLLINLLLSVFVLEGYLFWLVVIATMLCAIYQIVWVLPFTIIYPKAVQTVSTSENHYTIKILTSNVLMTNRNANKLVNLIFEHRPDIVVTLESDKWWEEALSPIHEHYPNRVPVPLDNLYGMHLYSRYPLENTKIEFLIQSGVPSISCNIVLSDEIFIECHFVHPAPPSPTENEFATKRDKELMLVANKVKDNDYPTIVTGDLNDVAWSPTTRAFRRVSALKDPRIGRGFFNTFHAAYFFARWPLDHIFHSSHFTVKRIQRLSSIHSDHYPLLSELVLEMYNKVTTENTDKEKSKLKRKLFIK